MLRILSHLSVPHKDSDASKHCKCMRRKHHHQSNVLGTTGKGEELQTYISAKPKDLKYAVFNKESDPLQYCPGVEGDEWYEYNQTATEALPIGSHAQGGPFIVR